MKCCHNFGSFEAWNCPSNSICCGFGNATNDCCNPATHECVADACVVLSLTITQITFQSVIDVFSPKNWTITVKVSDDTLVKNLYVTATHVIFGGGSEGFFLVSEKTAKNTYQAQMTYDTLKLLVGASLSISMRIEKMDGGENSYSTSDLMSLNFPTTFSVINSSLIFSAQKCGLAQCPSNDDCCFDSIVGKPICYNTTTHQCFNFKRVCSKSSSLCGTTVCYDRTIYTCYDNSLCPIGYLKCGNHCFHPSFYYCLNDILKQRTGDIACNGSMCKSPQLCCGNISCYTGQTTYCCPSPWNRRATHTLCPIVNGLAYQCCGESCYDPTKSYCCVISAPGGSSTRVCDARVAKVNCCGVRGAIFPFMNS
jgi:hypothetical protein